MDVFLHDRDTDEDGVLDEVGRARNVAISVPSGGRRTGCSAGRAVIPRSRRRAAGRCSSRTANNLVANDTNGVSDVFIHDRVLHTTTRLSRDADGQGGQRLRR